MVHNGHELRLKEAFIEVPQFGGDCFLRLKNGYTDGWDWNDRMSQ